MKTVNKWTKYGTVTLSDSCLLYAHALGVGFFFLLMGIFLFYKYQEVRAKNKSIRLLLESKKKGEKKVIKEQQ